MHSKKLEFTRWSRLLCKWPLSNRLSKLYFNSILSLEQVKSLVDEFEITREVESEFYPCHDTLHLHIKPEKPTSTEHSKLDYQYNNVGSHLFIASYTR